MATTTSSPTLDDFLRLPEAEPALEFVNGKVIQKVSPKGQHGTLQYEMARRFGQAIGPSKVARVFTELRSTFGGASPVPDISVYRWDRVPVDGKGRVANEFFTSPDLVVEIVSPGQSVTALFRKCIWYVENGVGITLLVDPDDETIFVFRPNQAPRALRDNDRIQISDVLPGFGSTVSEIFATLQMQ